MYNHKEIESKWQAYWEKNKTFKVENPPLTPPYQGGEQKIKPKYYCLDMFPFPSGAGLHVGHPEWMTANDIVARYKNAKGFNVLHPMGWDAFWLPAENYAIKTGTHPKVTTQENINNFRKQIKSLGFSYDWDREVDTTDPEYYKWTQWIFLKMFETGLAYEQDLPINYCPSCKTGLANEEVLNDFSCERCGTTVEKKKIRQWVLAITKYAERLLKDVDKLDWPEGIKDMQRNWIGKSEGCEFEMKVVNSSHFEENKNKAWKEVWKIKVYTTRIDTVFGMEYAVIAPDYSEVFNFISDTQKLACENYINHASQKSDQDRTADNKEKTWVFTWLYVVNPFNWREVELWIADYVLGNYGTWAVMAVPSHDIRDYEFHEQVMWIKWWTISIVPEKYKNTKDFTIKDTEDIWFPFTSYWYLVNSWDFSWLTSEKAKVKLTEFAEKNWFGTKKVNYKLRDWLFSRQRYWWEPIPLIHLEMDQVRSLPHINDISEATEDNLAYILKREPRDWESCVWTTCHWKVRELIIWGKVFSKIYDWLYGKIVCDYSLPLELPEVENFKPAWDANSPLAAVPEFVNVKLAENLNWKRETNTMPQWWGSCWYYLRYMDPKNPDRLVDRSVADYWWEVDSYVGGAEHAVLHLLYARFWHKFLFDIGVVPTDEPFYRLRNQGLILAYSYQNAKGRLIANDLVEEKTSPQPSPQGEGVATKYFDKETGEELQKVVAKMSKSLKNVVNPDEIIEEYGADTLRLYEMYMADFKDSAPWDTKNIIWVRRFIEKAERLFTSEAKISTEDDNSTMKLVHKTIKKVWEDIENYKFNTAIASLMILVNNWLPKDEKLQTEWKSIFVKLLNPFTPHLAEELWQRLGNKTSVFHASWPEYDAKMTVDDTITIAVQVLGKVRWTIEVAKDEDQASVLEKAKTNADVTKWLEWKTLVKEIYVPGKIVNLVVK